MSKKLLSIIIPVYNTQNYLSRCLETLVNQTFRDFEIVIVNDASTDNSEKIINEYATKYSYIKHCNLPQNIGVGNARNIGIEYANSQYISFIDSDDWVDSTYYERMVSSIIDTSADICVSGIKTEVEDVYYTKNRYNYSNNIIVDNLFCLHSLTDQYNHDIKISPIVNNKIYKKDLLIENNLWFNKTRRAQDIYFSFMVFVYANKVSLINDTFYHYYQRDGSATHNFSNKYIDDYFYILFTLKKTLVERNLYNMYEKEYLYYVNRCVTKLIGNLFYNEQRVKMQKQYLVYIIKKTTELLPIEVLLDCIDITRIKNFWNI